MKTVIEGGDVGIDEIYCHVEQPEPCPFSREPRTAMEAAFWAAEEDKYLRSFGQSYYNWCRRGGKK